MKKTKIKSIEELTKKGYYYVNSNITSANFPFPETVETEGWKIIPLEKHASSEECLKIIKDAGCRPANIYELALLRERNPEAFATGKYHVAFGSEWQDADGHRRVPCVDAFTDGDFEFDLGDFGVDWGSGVVLVCFCDKQPSDTLALKEDSGPLTLPAITDEIAIAHLKSKNYRITRMEEKEY